MPKARGRARTQNRSGHNITKGTAGERGNTNSGAEGESRWRREKQGMQVMTRGKGERKEWTTWIHKQNFGRGGGGLTGVEMIMILDGGPEGKNEIS